MLTEPANVALLKEAFIYVRESGVGWVPPTNNGGYLPYE